MTDLREVANELFQTAIARANPYDAVHDHLDQIPPLADGGRRIIIALGKAAVPMMRAALAGLPKPDAALVITNPENIASLENVKVMAGSHPVPDVHSEQAGIAVLEHLTDMRAEDQVLALISGGGSALMVAPVAGISLADKTAMTEILLTSGLDIVEMNLIRQQLSALKGGGLLSAAAPASVTALLLSDVIGDDIRAIASGPAATAIGSKTQAREILQRENVWDHIPNAVKHVLSQPDTQPVAAQASNHIIGSNRQSLDAMLEHATQMGWDAKIINDALVGDVQDACNEILKAVETAPTDRPIALLFGGETTVQINGQGQGGRNQELALRLSRAAQDIPGDWVFLSGGTDGRDGPTDAAGGCINAHSWAKVGPNAEALLANNDSYAALQAADGLLMTGGTGTNVADVQIFLRRPT